MHYCYIILRNVEGKKVCPFFLLESSRPLSPWGPLDFLSTCLGNDSLSFPGGSVVKNLSSNAGDTGLIPGSRRRISWRRKWQPIPVPLSGKSHGQRSPVGYSPWVCKESDITRLVTLWFLHTCFELLLVIIFDHVHMLFLIIFTTS